MSGKSGRLTFSGRNEYTVVPVFGHAFGKFSRIGEYIAAGVTGYAAKCNCALGDHYLVQYPTGFVSELLSDRGAVPDECIFPTAEAADAAIEVWHRQHDAAQAASGESEVE